EEPASVVAGPAGPPTPSQPPHGLLAPRLAPAALDPAAGRNRCRFQGSTPPRSAWIRDLPAAPSSLQQSPSTQPCSAERLRSTPASRA
ncbi:NFAT activation molecule 1 isoform 2 precursor, partial [Daubentonia madagascariensis]